MVDLSRGETAKISKIYLKMLLNRVICDELF